MIWFLATSVLTLITTSASLGNLIVCDSVNLSLIPSFYESLINKYYARDRIKKNTPSVYRSEMLKGSLVCFEVNLVSLFSLNPPGGLMLLACHFTLCVYDDISSPCHDCSPKYSRSEREEEMRQVKTLSSCDYFFKKSPPPLNLRISLN